jgi:hypothetical protein
VTKAELTKCINEKVKSKGERDMLLGAVDRAFKTGADGGDGEMTESELDAFMKTMN